MEHQLDSVDLDAVELETVELLTHGTLEITGRLTDASNVTLLGTVEHDGQSLECVYKPIRGERPLWDFPDGTLAERERAAYLVSRIAGWNCVPTTILRDGPVGPGMVQRWVDTPAARGDGGDLVDLCYPEELPDGWRPVLRAVDEQDRDILLAHADDPALAILAAFDVVTNNADRKGSHVLVPGDGRVLGVDHGLCLHSEEKLRTVLWGWAGEPLPETAVQGLRRLAEHLRAEGESPLPELLTLTEMRVLTRRIDDLLDDPQFPLPPRQRTPIPWPAL